jgi:D-alanyl-D-alanine carboxypeptidase
MPSSDRTRPSQTDRPVEGLEAATEHLEREVHRLAAQDHIKHAIVAIESVDRSFRWVGVAGDARPDGTPMREDTPFWIASVTKLYHAAVILKLYERGLIGLDEPMTTYLPQSLTVGIHRIGGVDYSESITIRHLLGHSSGLPDYLEDAPKGGRSLLDSIVEKDQSWTTEEAMRIVRESLTPHFPPQPVGAKRRKIRYSDTNYQLLIAIIENVTGRPLHEAFAEQFYRPLNLQHTYHPGIGAEPAEKPATVWAGERPLEVPLAMRSFRDLCSTADDTLTFLRALVRGEVFDNPATLDIMMGNWNRFGFSLNPAPTSPPWPIEYGLGMMRLRFPRIFSPLRPTPTMVGHTGVSGSWLFYSPELDALLSGTVDQMTAAAMPFRFVPRLLRILDSAAS